MVGKRDIDWGSLGFLYRPTDASFVCDYRDGAWDEGFLTADHTLTLSECAGILQYGQGCLEGLRATATVDGRVVCFRPELYAERLEDSARRLVMPPFPADRFLEGIERVVLANLGWVPPHGSGAALYLRPLLVATGATLAVRPADAYQFRILATPVGPAFPDGIASIRLIVTDYDRAAPNGTGAIGAAPNYAMGLWPAEMAHAQGYDGALYLDAATHTYIEEAGDASVILADRRGRLVAPVSRTYSTLPSITRRSLIAVARDVLGLEVVERPVRFDELGEFGEFGLCNTDAVIVPVMSVVDYDTDYIFNGGSDEIGPVLGRLRETLVAIQEGALEGPEGWLHEIRPAEPSGA